MENEFLFIIIYISDRDFNLISYVFYEVIFLVVIVGLKVILNF